jgi:tetratricopeptide (TPR) repeat protein
MDSIVSYRSRYYKRTTTLESALSLLDEAVKCDANFSTAKFNMISVLNELRRYHQSIHIIDDLILATKDSSLLLIKGPIYDSLNDHDSLRLTYIMANKYFVGKLVEQPTNTNLIYGMLFTKSKIFGKDSISSDVEYYAHKYPKDSVLRLLLHDISK